MIIRAVIPCLCCLGMLAGSFVVLPEPAVAASREEALSVYDQQAPVTEQELLKFVEILPRFRAWARENKEDAHPIKRNGKADFVYSPAAAAWVKSQQWDERRFFCVMGRMAAAVSIVAEGSDLRVLPPDMPKVEPSELELARVHMGELLKASGSGGEAPALKH